MKKFFLFFLIILFFPAVAAVPELPHQFYGSVTYLYSLIPNGHKLTAELGEERFTVDIIDGKYGIETPLLVSKDSSNSINDIAFYVDDKKVLTYGYHSGEFTKLNLDIPSNIVIIQETTVEDLGLEIGGSNDLSEDFTGFQKVEFKEDDKLLVEFDYDFDSYSVADLLENIIIKKQEGTATEGSIIIKGVDLPSGKTKIVYIDDLNENTNQVCIKDAEIASITEISGQCDEADETLLSCPDTGNTDNGYTCTDIGDYYKVEGLKHSGVVETEPEPVPPAPPDDDDDDDDDGGGGSGSTVSKTEDEEPSETCEPDWGCYEWLACVNGIQTRICYDTNKCGSNDGKPEEDRECTVSEEEVQTTTSAGEEKSSGMGAITGAAFGLGKGNTGGFVVTTIILAMFAAGLMIAYFIKDKARKKERDPSLDLDIEGFK